MSIVIKIVSCDGNASMRRRKFDTCNVTLAQVQEIANLQSNARLTWRDEDNDIILIETQSDLQEAIANAVAQSSSLRLFVENTRSSAQPAAQSPAQPAFQPTSDQPNPVQTPARKTFVQSLMIQFMLAIDCVRSTFAASPVVQAIKEDGCSIRAIFESRVERNLSVIQPIMSCVTQAVLLRTLVWPNFCLLFKVIIAAMLMPRNALSGKSRVRAGILMSLIGLRVGMSFLCTMLHTTCCVMIPLIFLLILVGCWRSYRSHRQCAYRVKRRCHRRRPHPCRPHPCRPVPSTYQSHPCRPVSSTYQSQEQEHMGTLRNIFPNISDAILRQVYREHKDIQKTIMELASQI